jgi:hypothetical protein
MSELNTLDSLVKEYCDKIDKLELKIAKIEEFAMSTGIFDKAYCKNDVSPPVKLNKDMCEKFYSILQE